MINTDTKILGLIGHPLEHSLSPRLHNYYLQEMELNYIYLPFDIVPGQLQAAVEGLKAFNFRGLNVTIPYKEKIINYLDETDSLARKIGAVNTVANEDGKLSGYNTDITGFTRMLNEDGEFEIEGKKALIIGAGGASRAVGFALAENGISRINIINRSETRAKKLVDYWQGYYPDIEFESGPLEDKYYRPLVEGVELVVDTTPVGMEPEIDVEPVISPEVLHEGLLVVDLVYNPLETTLIKAAKSRGARTLNGMSMLLYQGIESFKIWTGVEPEIEVFDRRILKRGEK